MYGVETIPPDHQVILKLNPLADTTKLIEIFFQDVVTLAIVVTLSQSEADINIAIFILTTIVFIVHIPAIEFFGKIFGTFWLIVSTALAPLAYYLLSFESGLYYLFILHVSTYFCLHAVIYILSKIKTHK